MPVFSNEIQMFRSPVSFVPCKIVLGKFIGKFKHQSISRDFGDDGCSGNAWFRFIAADDGTVWIVEPEVIAAVDEHVRRRRPLREITNRFLHRMLVGGENSLRLDHGDTSDANAERAVRYDPFECACALAERQGFAVGNANVRLMLPFVR